MATVERTEGKRKSKRPTSPSPQKKSHAFRNGCLVMLVLLTVGAYFAPVIIATTPLGHWIVQQAAPVEGSLSLGPMSLGWFSPISVEKIELRDPAGNSVLTVESFTSEKPLIGMLLDLDDVGTLHVVRPTVHVVAYEKDTNLERIIAPLLAGESSSNVSVAIDVTEATVELDDVFAGRKYQLNNIAATARVGKPSEGISLALSGALAGQQTPGAFKFAVHTEGSADGQNPLAAGKLDCQSTDLPLEILDPVIRRVAHGAKVSGTLTSKLDGAWGNLAEGGQTSVQGEVTLNQLKVRAAALGNDEFHLDRVQVPCHIVGTGDAIKIEQLAVNSDLGELTLSGTAKLSDFEATNIVSALAHENYQLTGKLDLARLAKMLPATLQIREGTEITSGKIALAATAEQKPEGMTWTGHINADQLHGKADGQSIAWNKPLAVQFAAHETKDGIVVDQATCTSSFLTAKAAGSLENLTGSVDFDLAQLLNELRQFSDLNSVQLAGKGHAQVALKRTPNDGFTADADFSARGFQWVRPQARPWREENLVAKLSMQGQLNGQVLKRVDECIVTVESGGDQLQATLRQPVTEPTTAAWPIKCTWRGQLAAWPPRLESCLGLTGWDLSGAGTLDADVSASSQLIKIESANAKVDQFQVVGSGLFINEPVATASVQAVCDLAKTRVEVATARLAAGSVTAVIEHAVLRMTTSGWAADGGTAQFAGELEQLARWTHDPRQPAAWQMSGKVTGAAQLKHADGSTTGQLDAAVDRLQIVDLSRPAKPGARSTSWQEPRVTVAALGSYLHAEERLVLDKFQVVADAVRCEAKGTVAAGDRGGKVDVNGTVHYDWEQLAPLWKPYLGPTFQIAGRQTREFAVRGELTGPVTSLDSWQQVSGEAAVGWTGMNAYGMQVGPGDVVAELAGGIVKTKPIDVAINQGRLTFAPVVRLTPAPAEMQLSPGPILNNIQLTPQICAQGLRFVTPLLANATTAEGSFSVTLDGGRVPLADPHAADIGGRMAIKGEARPGPLANEFVGLINELTAILQRGSLGKGNRLDSALMSIDSPSVEFRMVNRRVYHRGLTLMVGTLPITTQGSVGMDESISLVAEIPMQAQMLGLDLSLGTMEGQTLKIPIEGTLTKPRIDRRCLVDLPRQLIENTAKGVLIDGVGKGLKGLFPTQ
jgi:translocation and assembly module TamB